MSLLALALLLTTGQIYTWVDQDGVEHFTDDKSVIPRGVKVRVTEGDAIGQVTTGKKDQKEKKDTRGELVIPLDPAPVQPVVVVAAPDPHAEEDRWRRLFREARTRVTSLADEIEADRKRVEEVNGMPVRAGFVCPNFGVPPMVLAPTSGVGISVGATGQIAPGVAVSTTVGAGAVVRPFPTFVTPCGFGFNPEYERVRERLEKNRRELVRAQEELADLERRASFEAVPLHWRR